MTLMTFAPRYCPIQNQWTLKQTTLHDSSTSFFLLLGISNHISIDVVFQLPPNDWRILITLRSVVKKKYDNDDVERLHVLIVILTMEV